MGRGYRTGVCARNNAKPKKIIRFPHKGRRQVGVMAQVCDKKASLECFKNRSHTCAFARTFTVYRGDMEESEASRAQQRAGQVRLPGVAGNTPAPTASCK